MNSLKARQEITIEGHARVAVYLAEKNQGIDIQAIGSDIFAICIKKGDVELNVPFIPHPLPISSSEAIFLAYPREDWKIRIIPGDQAELIVIKMDLGSFHTLINPGFDAHQLEKPQKLNMRDLTRVLPVSPSLLTCFDQLMYHKLRQPFSQIFERAKFLEIFSLLLESAFSQPMEACPVVLSPGIESKLQQVRRHIIGHLDEVPNPDKLAVLYDLPRNTLREGYRYIYGKTIHQYHTDHKLESAMQMLHQGELLVKEVAFKIGYQNPSHFISAFKKKFGHTPKQYHKREIQY